MTMYCYAFEARSIQSYLSAGGKLKDIVAGSDLLDAFCGQPLDDILAVCGLDPVADITRQPGAVKFSRKAGGAFRLFATQCEGLTAMRDFISMVFPAYAPGLAFGHGLGEGKNAIEASRNVSAMLMEARNRPTLHMPEASPLALRCQRTGNAAVAGFDKEAVDLDLLQKRRWNRRHGSDSGIAGKLLQDVEGLSWPLQIAPQDRKEPSILEQTGSGGSNTVAVVHADGNGLGQLLIALNAFVGKAGISDQQYIQALFAFSNALETATREAADHACREVLLPVATERHLVMPARPLVLGGDDLTFLVRGDLALGFAKAFLREFETAIEKRLRVWRDGLPGSIDKNTIPVALTASAGIAYVKPRMPFMQSHALAEQLCKQAKEAGAAVVSPGAIKPSCISFARVTSSLIGTPEQLLGSLPADPARDVSDPIPLGLPTYQLKQTRAGQDGWPSLAAIEELVGALAKTGEGKPLRSVLNLMQSSPAAAAEEYRRWLVMLDKRGKKAGWTDKLANLGPASEQQGGNLPLLQIRGATFSPLGDLITLKSMQEAQS